MAYKRVVLALDVFAEGLETVVSRSRAVAGDADVTALHVVEDARLALGDQLAITDLGDLQDRLREESVRRLGALCERSGIGASAVRSGRPASEIHALAEAEGADLVAMGAHGRHGWQLLLGSTANAVLHGTGCDVLCVHVPGEGGDIREVLVAVDDAEDASLVLERATSIAAGTGARVSIVSVVRPLEHSYSGMDIAAFGDAGVRFVRDAEERLTAEVGALADRFGARGERLVRRGHPGAEIRRAAEELSADLVVLGTHGRHGLALLLGSTANAVLHGATTDILAVRLPA